MGALSCKWTSESAVRLEAAKEELVQLRRKTAEQNESLERAKARMEAFEQLKKTSAEQYESLVKELRENLQRVTQFARKQQKEKREKEREIVKLTRHSKYLEDKILAAQQVAVETQLRQLNELQSLTKETRELKDKLTLLYRQQHPQTAVTDQYHQGRYLFIRSFDRSSLLFFMSNATK